MIWPKKHLDFDFQLLKMRFKYILHQFSHLYFSDPSRAASRDHQLIIFLLKCDVPVRQLLLEEKLSAGQLSQKVAVFVELLWTEALGILKFILRVPVDKLSLNDVSLFHNRQTTVYRIGICQELTFFSSSPAFAGEQGGGLVASGSQEAKGGKSNGGVISPG